MHMPASRMDNLVSLSKRRGFAYPGSEIYGGLRASWDYGPLGAELKNNIKRHWWRTMVQKRDDIVGLDSCIVLAPQVWETSGHVTGFSDPLTECTSCHTRHRADQLEEQYEAKHGRPPANGLRDVNCPSCGTKGQFTEPRQFNGMMKSFMGPVEDSSAQVWLRPETAQGIFVNYLNVQQSARRKPPFGIAQIGKSFRNEITPGNFIFRTREFEQMEMEFFVPPAEGDRWFEYWKAERIGWFRDLGINESNLRFYEHPKEKLAHYSRGTFDIEYRFDFPRTEWAELEGIAYRGDFDLSSHAKASGVDLSYYDQESDERYVPHVVEPALGVDRTALVVLLDGLTEDEAPTGKGGVEKRAVLKIDRRLAPIKVAVLPLSRNERLSPMAKELAQTLRERWSTDFDDAGAIGRRYRRQDEVGTPFCVTVDFESLDDNAVTVRERDSMTQERIPLAEVERYLSEQLPIC